ncbi:MAG: hypothetical protein R2684_08005 [Pyrinomonadaceae bacterium]
MVTLLVKEAGYVRGYTEDFDREYAVDVPKLLKFLSSTQLETNKNLGIAGDRLKRNKFLNRPQIYIRKRGIVEMLRGGIKYGSAHLELFYETPTPGNVKAEQWFAANILS